MKRPDIDELVPHHTDKLVLSDSMKARIAAGEVDEEHVRKANTYLILLLDNATQKIEDGEWEEQKKLAEAGLIDPDAYLSGAGQRSLIELLTIRHVEHILWPTLFPFLDNPNRQTGGTILCLPAAYSTEKFRLLLDHPQLDFNVKTVPGTIDHSLRKHLNEEIERFLDPQNHQTTEKSQTTTRVFNNYVDSILLARAHGVHIGEPDLDTFRQDALDAIPDWQEIRDGKLSITSLSESAIKKLAGIHGMSAVFAPPLWRGAEAQALAMIETFNPSLQDRVTREVAALQHAIGTDTNAPWRSRIGHSTGWQKGA